VHPEVKNFDRYGRGWPPDYSGIVRTRASERRVRIRICRRGGPDGLARTETSSVRRKGSSGCRRPHKTVCIPTVTVPHDAGGIKGTGRDFVPRTGSTMARTSSRRHPRLTSERVPGRATYTRESLNAKSYALTPISEFFQVAPESSVKLTDRFRRQIPPASLRPNPVPVVSLCPGSQRPSLRGRGSPRSWPKIFSSSPLHPENG